MGLFKKYLTPEQAPPQSLRSDIKVAKEEKAEMSAAAAVLKARTEALILADTFEEDVMLRRQMQDTIDKEAFAPHIVKGYTGESEKQWEKGFLGLMDAPRPLGDPSNVKSPQKIGLRQGLLEALSPQTVSGPMADPTQGVIGSSEVKSRSERVFSEAEFLDETKGKTAEEKLRAKELLLAKRAMAEQILKNLPSISDEDFVKTLNEELQDLSPAIEGTSTRRKQVKQEPGKARNVAESIISTPSTTAGEFPDLTGPQMAFVKTMSDISQTRRQKEAAVALRKQLTTVPDKFPVGLADPETGKVQSEERLRTPEEVDAEYKRRWPEVLKQLKTPFWADPVRKAEVIENPKLVENVDWMGTKQYVSGATAEGYGAHKLRQIMAPFNIVTTAMVSGAARLGEALGRDPSVDPKETVSSMDTMRLRRNNKGSNLDEGFLGDLENAVMYNTDSATAIRDNFKELGMSKPMQDVGFGLGFSLSILTPPLGGVVSSGVAGVKGVTVARAIRAAGLIGPSPVKAGVTEAANAFRNAWTYGGKSVVPGSLKILAAEDTAEALILRQRLDELPLDASADEIMKIVDEPIFEAGGKPTVRVSTLHKEFRKAAQEGDLFRQMTETLIDTNKGIWRGSKRLLENNDNLMNTIKGVEGAVAQDPKTLKLVLFNAASRSDEVLRALGEIPGGKQVGNIPDTETSKLLKVAMAADPDAVKAAVGSVTAFDAFNKSGKALGYAEHADLVLVTPRFIATPDVAIKLAKAASETRLGVLLNEIVSANAVPMLKRERVWGGTQQTIELTVKQADELTAFFYGMRKAGYFSVTDQQLMSGLVYKGKPGTVRNISLDGLRKMFDANIDRIISKRGLGVDIKSIQVALDAKGEIKAAASQIVAKEKLLTPPELRSAFDGISTRINSLFRGPGSLDKELLKLDPMEAKMLLDIEKKLSRLNVTIKTLVNDLVANNPVLRVGYDLPETGAVTIDEAVLAIIKKTNVGGDINFVNSVTTLLFSSATYKPVFMDYFKKLNWEAPNFSLLSPDGTQMLNHLKNTFKNELKFENNLGAGLETFFTEVKKLQGDEKMWLPGSMPKDLVEVKQGDMGKLIGAGLFDTYAQAERARYKGMLKASGLEASEDIQKHIDMLTNRKALEPIIEAFAKQINSSSVETGQHLLNGFLWVLRTLTKIRYGGMLAARPAYHMQNTLGVGFLLHGTAGMKNIPNPVEISMASKVMASAEESGLVFRTVVDPNPFLRLKDEAILFKDVYGKPYTTRDILEIGVKTGSFKTEQQTLFSIDTFNDVVKLVGDKEVPPGFWNTLKGVFKMPVGGVAKAKRVGELVDTSIDNTLGSLTDAANATDNTFRTAVLIKALKRGDPIPVAQTLGKKSLFDYGDIGEAERQIAAHILVFTSFSRLQAQQLLKAVGSTEGASRFVKQMAVGRDINKFLYEKSGGRDYDYMQFIMGDKDLYRTKWPSGHKIATSEYYTVTPGLLPQAEAFMLIVNMLYQKEPAGILASETGVSQFLSPELKELMGMSLNIVNKRRSTKLKLVDPSHMVMWKLNPGLFEATFGPVKALEPSSDTTTVFQGKEWQLVDPAGYAKYSTMARWAAVGGLQSIVSTYAPLSGDIDVPGQTSTVKKLFGFGEQVRKSPEQQELVVLEGQSETLSSIAKMYRQQLIEKELSK